MRRCMAIFLLGLLGIQPASAQKIYSLTVSIQEEVRNTLTEAAVQNILERASNLLQGRGSAADTGNHCAVGFKLKGPLTTFTSAPPDINNASDLEAVHRVPADVKVVRAINFCVNEYNPGKFVGCSWRPNNLPKTVIVTPPSVTSDDLEHITWVHEFGHTTGLSHRYNKNNPQDQLNLMSPCELQLYSRNIDEDECRHFLAGPVQHYPPGLGAKCPADSSTRTD